MFVKLIKYDLKAMLKTMLPLWITVIVLGGMLGISISSSNWENSFMSMWLNGRMYPMELLIFALFGVFVAILVMNVLMVIRRFWDGLLKDEGYLMFTLPVSTRTLILSKVAGALIVTLLSVVTAYIVIALVLLFSSEGRVLDIFAEVTEYISLGRSEGVFVLLTLINIVLRVLAAIYRLYAAMSIGHLSNNNRFLTSFLAFIGLNVIIGTLCTPIVSIIISKTSNMNTIVLLDIISNLILIVICHVVTEVILTTRLNLE